MRHKSLALCLTLLPLLSAAAARAVAAQGRDAGIVERINGRVSWRSADGSRVETLRAGADTARRLHVNESVRAAHGGLVVLILCDGRRELRAADGWFRVPESAQCRAGEPLAEYGGPGGRDRGPSDIYSPANNAAIRPETLTLRWKPSPELRSFTARLVRSAGMEDEKEVWSRRVADGGTGVLVSAEARRALARERDASRRTTVTLFIEPASPPKRSVTFALLSLEEWRGLPPKLASWDAERSPLMRRLGRASVFASLNMFAEAAAEYEAALALAPRSRDLLVRTIQSECEAANEPRAEELRKRLPRGTPDPCAGETTNNSGAYLNAGSPEANRP